MRPSSQIGQSHGRWTDQGKCQECQECQFKASLVPAGRMRLVFLGAGKHGHRRCRAKGRGAEVDAFTAQPRGEGSTLFSGRAHPVGHSLSSAGLKISPQDGLCRRSYKHDGRIFAKNQSNYPLRPDQGISPSDHTGCPAEPNSEDAFSGLAFV